MRLIYQETIVAGARAIRLKRNLVTATATTEDPAENACNHVFDLGYLLERLNPPNTGYAKARAQAPNDTCLVCRRKVDRTLL